MEKDLFGNEIVKKPLLRDKFIEPPFSILDTKSGNWQRRKKMWGKLGIKSEVGRDVKVNANLKPLREVGIAYSRTSVKSKLLTLLVSEIQASVPSAMLEKGEGEIVYWRWLRFRLFIKLFFVNKIEENTCQSEFKPLFLDSKITNLKYVSISK